MVKKNAKGHNYVSILWNLPKVNQVIYNSIPNIKALAQIAFEISC